MKRLYPSHWEAYELLDFGSGKRLEMWNGVKLIRPDVLAKNDVLHPELWQDIHAEFEGGAKQKGAWKEFKPMPSNWAINYPLREGKHRKELTFRLKLTNFKHVGLFPEQAANWEWISEQLEQQGAGSSVLNLFAYTGGASLAARASGADVTHVDSIKQVVSWSRENMEQSNLEDIRWIVEDALKFAQREIKRGKHYAGIIMDPPSFGRGPKGERWRLDELMPQLLKSAKALLPKGSWLVFNTYSGTSIPDVKALAQQYFKGSAIKVDLLALESTNGKLLDTGVVLRIIV